MLKLYRSTRGANLLGCIACKGHYHSRGGVYGYNAPEWRKHEEKLKQGKLNSGWTDFLDALDSIVRKDFVRVKIKAGILSTF